MLQLRRFTRLAAKGREHPGSFPASQRRVGIVEDLGNGVLVTEDARLVFVVQVEGQEDPDVMDEGEEKSAYAAYFQWLWHLEERVQFFLVTAPVTGSAVCPALRRCFARVTDPLKREGFADWIRMLENRVWYQTHSYAVISERIPSEGDGAVDPVTMLPAFEITAANVIQSLVSLGVNVRALDDDELERVVASAVGQWDHNSAWNTAEEEVA